MRNVKELLKQACERCEEHSVETSCEVRQSCPVYNLYLAATKCKKTTSQCDPNSYQGHTDFYYQKPEMI